MGRSDSVSRPGCGVLALAIVLAASAAFAQAVGGLRVTVVDEAGEALEGVVVELRHASGRLLPQRQTTDARGAAEFPVLAAEGEWTVAVDDGGQVRAERAVHVAIGAITPVLIRLAEDLEAETPAAPGGAVDAETTASITRFPEDFVRQLPIRGRFYQQVLPIAPAVDDADGDGNPRVHGSTSRDFRAYVNGIANVDPFTNQFMNFVNSDSIEEIAVIPAGASLEFGRAQGGFAAITQKIGSNGFAVSGELRYRTSKLDGEGSSTDGTRDVEFRSVQPSVIVSGPIVKDKLWYRLAWESVDQELPIDVPSGLEVQKRSQTIQAYQLTWQAASKHRFALQYQTDPLEIRGFGIDSSVPMEASQYLDAESKTTSLVYTVPVSSRMLLESTVAVQERSTLLVPTACLDGSTWQAQAACTSTIVRSTGSYPGAVDTETDRLSLAFRGTWHAGRLAGVAHRLRFGFVYENDRIDRALALGTTALGTTVSVFEPGGSSSETTILVAELTATPVQSAEIDGDNVAVYLEDRIRPSRNLVIDFGLRLDREQLFLQGFTPFDPVAEREAFLGYLDNPDVVDPFRPSTTIEGALDPFTSFDYESELIELARRLQVSADELLGSLSNLQRQARFWNHERLPTSVDISNTNLSPTLAISWDPWNDGRNKFAASARRYYGTLLQAAPLLEQEAPTMTLAFEAFEDPLTGEPLLGGLLDRTSPINGVTVVDHDLDTPYQDEWRLVYERELWRENRLHVEYVNRKYRDQLQLDDINRRTGDLGRCFMAQEIFDPSIIESPGVGDVVDLYTGEVYADTDPGIGDGRLDDCVGETELVRVTDPEGGVRQVFLPRPDGAEDRYVQNPVWGSILQINNDGRRDYEAFVLDFVRRQIGGWGMQASYVWSTFEGSAEPFEPYVGPHRRQFENRAGAESNDQRHVVKIAGNGVLRGDWRLGGIVTWQSGLPYSLVRSDLDEMPLPPDLSVGSTAPVRSRIVYQTAERNTERNDSYWLADVRVAKGFTFAGQGRVELALDVFNLFDEQTLQVYNPDTEIGLQLDGVARARRLFGRAYQLGIRVTY